MTLDDLHEHFLTAEAAYWATWMGGGIRTVVRPPVEEVARWPDCSIAPWHISKRHYVDAARLFVVARDEGLNAAMLYKLSAGAQDPREVR